MFSPRKVIRRKSMQPKMWKPPVALSQQEEQIVKKVRKAKLFVFLREHRQELFDEAFQEELASLYRKAERGQPPVAPALLVSLGGQYFLLLEVSAAAHLISEE